MGDNIIKKTEIDAKLQKYFDEMESKEGIYDIISGREELISFDKITPRQRLNEMFLKRLYDHYIGLSIPYTKEFGSIKLPEPFKFNINGINQQDMCSYVRFESDTGVVGRMKLDWLNMTLTMTPESENDVVESIIYTVHQYLVSWMTPMEDFTVEIGLLLDMSRLDEGRTDEGSILDDMSFNKWFIEQGVLEQAQRGSGYIPERPVTFKSISDITGVSASTLSDLKNGNKSIDNLTLNTLSVLSFYGNIKNLESFIYNMIFKQLQSDYLDEYILTIEHFGIIITKYDGQEIIVDAASLDSAKMLYESIIESFNKRERAFSIQFAITHGRKYHNYMIQKDDVKDIRIDKYKPNVVYKEDFEIDS